jgi:hypothetical protein
MGYGLSDVEAIRIRDWLSRLKSHPNFKEQVPLEGETQIEFALRSAAHLISPPMEDGESTHIECVDLALAVRALAPELNDIWSKHQKQQ